MVWRWRLGYKKKEDYSPFFLAGGGGGGGKRGGEGEEHVCLVETWGAGEGLPAMNQHLFMEYYNLHAVQTPAWTFTPWVTSCQFLLTVLWPNQTSRSSEKRKWSLTMEALDCNTNSPCLHLRNCIENSMENMHAEVRVWRVYGPRKCCA